MNTGPALPTVDTRQNLFSITATKVIMYTQMKHQTLNPAWVWLLLF